MTRRRGFTLVELILVFALTAILMATFTFSLGQNLRTWRKIVRRAEKQQVERIVLERICRDLRAAADAAYAWEDGKVKRNKNYLTSENETGALSFSTLAGQAVEIKLGDLHAIVTPGDQP